MLSQHILGIRPEMDGLCIDPCIPADCKGFTCTRKFRGSEYHITVKNPDGAQKGVASMTVNGEKTEGNVIPVPAAGSVCEVEVVMG